MVATTPLLLFSATLIHCHSSLDSGHQLLQLGVTTHSHMSFNATRAEMAQLARGFRVVRTDLRWNLVQPKGAGHSYDWSLYDGLLARLAANEIVPLLILDRPPIGGAPSTPSAAASFAQFAVDAVRRYRGRGVLFELWNEPDINDYSTLAKPNATAYATLAHAVCAALHRAGLDNETIIGPALAGDDAGLDPGIDYAFLEQLFSASPGGVPTCFDAISVHPYQQGPPEQVLHSYTRLRTLLTRYGAARLPVVCSEWGYSTCRHPCQTKELHTTTEELQARYLLRSWLCNAASGVAISVFCERVFTHLRPPRITSVITLVASSACRITLVALELSSFGFVC